MLLPTLVATMVLAGVSLLAVSRLRSRKGGRFDLKAFNFDLAKDLELRKLQH